MRRTPPALAVGYLPQEASAEGVSGGEAARARLGEFLRTPLGVFLLDEPTNDLDFDGLAWLERSLARLDGAVVLISHDRDFLDRTVDRIVELDEWTHGATEFAGGWSAYERTRDECAATTARGVRALRRREGAARRPDAADAALGGTGLRAGTQEEANEGRQEAVRRPHRPARADRETVRAVGAADAALVRTSQRRRRRAAGGRCRGTRLLYARPAPPRAGLGRPPRARRAERERQVDADRRPARSSSALGRASCGSGQASSSAS